MATSSRGGGGGSGHPADAWNTVSGVLIASGAALGAALAFLLVHAGVLTVVALAVLPFAIWLVSRSFGGLVMGLVLMLVLPSWHSLGVPHLDIFRAASIAAAVTLLVNRRVRLHRIDLALLLLICVLVGDWLLRYRQPGAGSALVLQLVPIGFYLGARAVPPGHIRTVALFVVVAGAIGGLTVIYEFTRGHVLFNNTSSYDWSASDSSIFRPGGVFGSPPAASTVMCCVVLFGIACSAIHRGKLRLVSAICTVIASLALVLTFTRAAYIAAGAAILLLLWLVRSPLLRPLRVAWFMVAVGALYFLLVPALQGNATFQEGVIRPGTLAARESYWKVALPVATSSAHTFILGTGTGTLEAPRAGPRTALAAAKLAESPLLTDDSLHNQYITTFVEQGALGLAALVFLLLAGMVPPARIARAVRDPISGAVAVCILAIAVIMSVDTAFLVPPSLAMLMALLGFAANMTTSRSSPLILETAEE